MVEFNGPPEYTDATGWAEEAGSSSTGLVHTLDLADLLAQLGLMILAGLRDEADQGLGGPCQGLDAFGRCHSQCVTPSRGKTSRPIYTLFLDLDFPRISENDISGNCTKSYL